MFAPSFVDDNASIYQRILSCPEDNLVLLNELFSSLENNVFFRKFCLEKIFFIYVPKLFDF